MRRRELAASYSAQLVPSPLILPRAVGPVRHVYHLYVMRAPDREALPAHLRARGISGQVHYPAPVHLQPAYTHLGFAAGSLPETERAAGEVHHCPYTRK